MALKSGRVGVAPDQVDLYGRLQVTEYLIEQLRDILDVESAEVSALTNARLEWERQNLLHPITPIDNPIITEPIDLEPRTVSEEVQEEEVTPKKTTRRKS